MQYCTKCILPKTHETIEFDSEGVCNICRQAEVKHDEINWSERRKMLDNIVNEYRDKDQYDCIVPFSGGKDSTFQLWYVITHLKLKPLVVRFDHWGYRPLVEENNIKTFKKLGVDVLNFTPNWKVVKELMLEALKRTGDFCWHCHTGVYAHTMQVAVRYKIPLIIWGESSSEYRAFHKMEELEELDETLFNEIVNLGITADDMHKYLNGRVTKRDLLPYCFPNKEELTAISAKPIFLGNYIKWDTRDNVEIIKKELDWVGQRVEGIPSEYDYEKIECRFQGVRDFCKFIKRGHGRTNHLACIDIRNGDLDREEGLKMSLEYDGKKPKSLEYFLELLGIEEEEFIDIVANNQVEDWGFNIEEIETGKELPDMKDWDRII